MKDSELQIDRSCHVLYSKPCKKEILAKITLHYPEAEREVMRSGEAHGPEETAFTREAAETIKELAQEDRERHQAREKPG